MSFLELAKRRYSSRSYQDKPVEKELLLQVMEAGRIAPSAKNNQPWHFVAITEKEPLAKIRDCYEEPWLETAKAIIVVCGDHRDAWRRSAGKIYTDMDVASAVSYMTLAATDLGLATCWICKFDVMKCVNILDLPDGVVPMVLLPIGYPTDEVDINRHEQLRKPLKEVVHFEKFFYKPFKR